MKDREPGPKKGPFGKLEETLRGDADWYSKQAKEAHERGRRTANLLNRTGSQILSETADVISPLAKAEQVVIKAGKTLRPNK